MSQITEGRPHRRVHQSAGRRGLAVLALSAGGLAAGATAAASVTTHAMTHRYVGTLTKLDSKAAFTMVVGKHHYVVTVDAMTHVRLGGKAVAFSHLHVGDHLIVTGTATMSDIHATAVTVTGM